MIALSNLLNIPVQSVYPNTNGSKHLAFQTLNTVFRPPFADPQKGQIVIMWTNTSLPTVAPNSGRQRLPKSEWTPNHFVSLVNLDNRITRPFKFDTGSNNKESVETYVSPNKFEVLSTWDVVSSMRDVQKVSSMDVQRSFERDLRKLQ